MRIDNSNERYFNIIAGILVAVLVSIFVAFALGVGNFKTDFPRYIPPLSVESPKDAGKEVSEINVLGNNADVAIAKTYEETVTVCGGQLVYIDETYTTNLECDPEWDDYFTNYLDLDDLPCRIGEEYFDMYYTDIGGLHFTIAGKGLVPDEVGGYNGYIYLYNDDTDELLYTINLIAGPWHEYFDVSTANLPSVFDEEELENWGFWNFWLDHEGEIVLVEPFCGPCDIRIEVEIFWYLLCCDTACVQILLQE